MNNSMDKVGTDVISEHTIVNTNELILYDRTKGLYVKSLTETNEVDEYTSDASFALGIPNTINFLNSLYYAKYKGLIDSGNFQVGNRKKITQKILKVEW